MRLAAGRRLHPELKAIINEASRALASLEADRLEELAGICTALHRELDDQDRAELARQARAAAADMAVFARVLQATSANINVMTRLRELRAGQLEYRPACAAEPAPALTGAALGND